MIFKTLEAISNENECIKNETCDQNVNKALEISAFIDGLNPNEFYIQLVSEDLQCFCSLRSLLIPHSIIQDHP